MLSPILKDIVNCIITDANSKKNAIEMINYLIQYLCDS